MQKNKPKFIAHCSRLSDVMSEPVSKKDREDGKLSKTCITYLNEWIGENYYNRKTQVETDAMAKGSEMEIEGAVILSKHLGIEVSLTKIRKENEWITGQIDYDCKPVIRDSKICETFSTFDVIGYEAEPKYKAQMQGYMMLWGEDYTHAFIDKLLVNSPAWLIQKKLQFLFHDWQKKFGESFFEYEKEYDLRAYELFKQHVFDKSVTVINNGIEMQLKDDDVISIENRVRSSRVDRDNDYISRIPVQVEKCREYLKKQGY